MAPRSLMSGILFSLGLAVAVCTPLAAQNSPAVAPAAMEPLQLPLALPELRVGEKVYYNVQVREVSVVSIFIVHRGGVGTIPLADLSPDLQKRFGYDPEKAAAELARRQAQIDLQRIREGVLAGDKGPPYMQAAQILRRFGQPPTIFGEVNMRPRFEMLGMESKNQGARPSCAVFAIVSALEYQQASKQGPATKLSEEYLIWATLKTLGRESVRLPREEVLGFDIGFSLTEVAQALRAYGIALDEEVPYRLRSSDSKAVEISADVIERAKTRGPADGFYVTGREPKAQIANLMQVLNAGVPVIVGLKWPDEKTLTEKAVLDAQSGLEKDDHAVLFVGYRTRTGKIEDTEFLFKNSYGSKWGVQGYGLVTYRYLVKNIQAALFLDVRK